MQKYAKDMQKICKKYAKFNNIFLYKIKVCIIDIINRYHY